MGSQHSRAMEIEKKVQCQNQSKQKGPKQNPYHREENVKKAYEDIKNKIIETEEEEIKTVMGSQQSRALEIEKKNYGVEIRANRRDPNRIHIPWRKM